MGKSKTVNISKIEINQRNISRNKYEAVKYFDTNKEKFFFVSKTFFLGLYNVEACQNILRFCLLFRSLIQYYDDLYIHSFYFMIYI